jgi:hypothetical protein
MKNPNDRTRAERFQYMEAEVRILAKGPHTTEALHKGVCSEGLTKVKKDAIANDQKLLETEGVTVQTGHPREWSLKVSLDQALKVIRALAQGGPAVSKPMKGSDIRLSEYEAGVLDKVLSGSTITAPEMVGKLHPGAVSKAEKERVYKTLFKLFEAGKVARSKDKPFRYSPPGSGIPSNPAVNGHRATTTVIQPSSKPSSMSDDVMNEAKEWRKIMTKAIDDEDLQMESVAKSFLTKLAAQVGS